jgi:hypothetical protein
MEVIAARLVGGSSEPSLVESGRAVGRSAGMRGGVGIGEEARSEGRQSGRSKKKPPVGPGPFAWHLPD